MFLLSCLPFSAFEGFSMYSLFLVTKVELGDSFLRSATGGVVLARRLAEFGRDQLRGRLFCPFAPCLAVVQWEAWEELKINLPHLSKPALFFSR